MSPDLTRLAHDLRNFLGLAPKVSASEANDVATQTHFMEIHRRIRIYLRALWDTDFILNETDVGLAEEEERKPFIEDFQINLPNFLFDTRIDGAGHVTGLEVYRAAAAHASAHIIFSSSGYAYRSLEKIQIAMISMVEDARVEALSILRFPGLKYIWAKQHKATPLDNRTAGDYLNRLARALLDDTYKDDDPWITQGRALFKSAGNLEDKLISMEIGLSLADSFKKKKIKSNRQDILLNALYRDDNRFLWKRSGQPLEIINPYIKSSTRVRIDESGADSTNPDATVQKAESRIGVLDTFHYPEWNYRSKSLDPSWVTIREKTTASGNLTIVDRIVADNIYLLSRMKAILHAIRDGAVCRIRKLEDGDEIDINAAILAQINIRLRLHPDTRVMMRTAHKARDISVLMLLDLSNSMNNIVQARGYTALQLTRQVSVLFAEAIDAVGDEFAIHGFCSESRHNVEYYRIKDFGQPYDDGAKARIAGMTGQLGTRMGAAIRHATHYLTSQKSSKKLLILLSDGEPHDVDMPNQRYLRDDAKQSVEEARRSGIHTYCISLDPGADKYVSRIFGSKNYIVVDHVKSLPEKVFRIYAALTR